MPRIAIQATFIWFLTISVLATSQSEAQQNDSELKVKRIPVGSSPQLSLESIDIKKSQLDELEIQPLNEFQIRVQKRYAEVTEQGFGFALLLQPFSTKYRLYKYRVIDNQAVQGDIVLGNVRQVIRSSIANRDAGFKAGDLSSTTIEGANLPPPLIADAAYRWPGGEVYYEIRKDDFTSDQIDIVEKAIATLNSSTNLSIWHKMSIHKDYVLIVGDKKLVGGGQSKVGRQSGKQKLTLNTSIGKTFDPLTGVFTDTKYAFGEGTVKHEFMHAVGFKHEQTRRDRGKYINILWKNIIDGEEHNFEIDETRTFSDYNYGSIMHYSKTAFGKQCHISDYAVNNFCKGCSIKKEADYLAALENGVECKKITMRTKTSSDISPSNELTPGDISAINAAYPADTITKTGNTLPKLEEYRTFILIVEKLKRVAGTKGESSALCGKYPDFIGEIVVGDVKELDTGNDKKGLLLVNDTTLSKKKKKDKEVGDTVTPNWKIDVPVGPNTKELYVIVKVWEYDDTMCGGKNDLVDISPQSDQGYLRLLVNLETGELQHLRPQSATDMGNTVYYERARYSGYNIFDSATGRFVSNTFSGLEDKSATDYQMEASTTIKVTIQ